VEFLLYAWSLEGFVWHFYFDLIVALLGIFLGDQI
jgi:hypothetical protein